MLSRPETILHTKFLLCLSIKIIAYTSFILHEKQTQRSLKESYRMSLYYGYGKGIQSRRISSLFSFLLSSLFSFLLSSLFSFSLSSLFSFSCYHHCFSLPHPLDPSVPVSLLYLVLNYWGYCRHPLRLNYQMFLLPCPVSVAVFVVDLLYFPCY